MESCRTLFESDIFTLCLASWNPVYEIIFQRTILNEDEKSQTMNLYEYEFFLLTKKIDQLASNAHYIRKWLQPTWPLSFGRTQIKLLLYKNVLYTS